VLLGLKRGGGWILVHIHQHRR